MLTSVLVASISQIILKTSANKNHTSIIREYVNPHVIIGYGMLLMSTVLTLFAFQSGLEYKSGPLIESTGYIFIMVLGRIILKEKITRKKIIGNALILAGIFIYYL